MAKRFTATEKWDDPFFCNLEAKYKLAWIYLLDKCDNAGIYDVNIKALSFFVGFDFNEDDLLSVFDGRIEKIKNGNKWFIPKFIEFQYGALRHECYPHRPVIEKLSKLGLLENKGSFRVSARVQDKDKEKDKEQYKDKEQDKDKEQEENSVGKPPAKPKKHKTEKFDMFDREENELFNYYKFDETFKAKWNEWKTYRKKEKRNPITTDAMRRQLKLLDSLEDRKSVV